MMQTTESELRRWLLEPENYHLEFKAAHRSFDQRSELPKYCSALANEGGGFLVLGVEDKTHRIVGTSAFTGTYTNLANDLFNRFRIRIDVDELYVDGNRLIIFRIPSRPVGSTIKHDGVAYMRTGEGTRPMTDAELRVIFNELRPDLSAEIIPGAHLRDLDSAAIQRLRETWSRFRKKPEYSSYDAVKTLESLGLIESESQITLAAMVLLGSEKSLRKYVPQSEVVIEWRQNETDTNFGFRENIRKPFILAIDEVWSLIDARNIRFPFQEGFVQRRIDAFMEDTVRESIMNAVMHRDYSKTAFSVFIKFSPTSFTVESPGGLINGITPENICEKKAWRNRLLAETLEKVGLVEKSGQGMDKIFTESIKSGKGIPHIWTDGEEVRIRVNASLQDADFVKFLELIENEKQQSLSFEEIVELESIRSHGALRSIGNARRLIELGFIERVGRGRGAKYVLSRKYYQSLGKPAEFTKLVGFDREEKKELILKFLSHHKTGTLQQIGELFPHIKSKDLGNLLQELRRASKITYVGKRRYGQWILAKE